LEFKTASPPWAALFASPFIRTVVVSVDGFGDFLKACGERAREQIRGLNNMWIKGPRIIRLGR